MFAFIKNLFLKNKAKKILSYVEKVETSLTLFQNINNNEDKNTKLIRSLSKKELYADIVSRYNVCIQKNPRAILHGDEEPIKRRDYSCSSSMAAA